VQIPGWIRRRLRPKTFGEQGERVAEDYLKRRGYRIVSRRGRSRFGEIDLVAVDGKTVVFVEVKTRRSAAKVHPDEAVDARKQRRLTQAALAFLKTHGLLECAARFDVVAITWPDAKAKPHVEHFKDAFPATGTRQFFS
jgi:putative endonuclease